MIQITITDPSKTNPAELNAVANLLLAFATAKGVISHEDNPATGKDETPLPTIIPSYVPPAPVAPSAPSASEAFKAPAAPNVPVPPAPSIVDAAQSSIVPVEQTATLAAVPTAPTPPAPPLAPSAATAVPPAGLPAVNVELDKRGLPWDARIHSSNHAKNADLSWRAKRNVDPELVKVVEQELRGVASIAVAPPPAWPYPNDAAALGMVTPPAPPMPPAAPAGITFAQLLPKITGAIARKETTQANVIAVLNAFGLASLPLLGSRPDLIPQIDSALFP